MYFISQEKSQKFVSSIDACAYTSLSSPPPPPPPPTTYPNKNICSSFAMIGPLLNAFHQSNNWENGFITFCFLIICAAQVGY